MGRGDRATRRWHNDRIRKAKARRRRRQATPAADQTPPTTGARPTEQR
jgi:hypothetical protein